MKPGTTLKTVIPRAVRARRRLSTTSVIGSLSLSQQPILFDCPSPSWGSQQPGSSSSSSSSSPPPKVFKLSFHPTTPTSPTTAISLYSAPSSHSSQPSSLMVHPRYTTNTSNAYPGSSLPLICLVPNGNAGNSDIERQMPWDMTAKGKGKEPNAYTLDMGAYGIPKRRKPQQRGDEVKDSATRSPAESHESFSKDDISRYNLAVQVGEDAYFLRPDALGVADGVGGWKYKGESNSALFAKKLMHFCSAELSRLSSSSSSHHAPPHRTSKYSSPTRVQPDPSSSSPSSITLDPIQILQTSYEKCVADARESGYLGSSTATLAVLTDSELRIAHVGDCVVCVVRDGEMVFRSDEMQHSFNYPYQLGPKSTTTPKKDAQHIVVPVRANDIVILASDGMGDNLWDEDVLDEVNRFIRTSPSGVPSPPGSGLTFAASTSSSSSPPTSSFVQAHAPAGPVTNTVLAQRLSEALASRAKRVSERRVESSPPPPQQTPTPPPTPKLKDIELPEYINLSTTRPDGELDIDFLGDGFGGDGEYGGSGYHIEEEEWVKDETPFSRKARESGVGFVGGKSDDISVLVAIISAAPTSL